MAERTVVFAVPGSLAQRTGGYGYDRRVVAELRAAGRGVTVVELPGRFPICDAHARDGAAKTLADVPDGSTLVIDGLALPAFEGRFPTPAVALVHHPLALETGLRESDRVRLAKVETAALAQLDGIVTTSPATVRLLVRGGLPANRIRAVPPGTDPAERARGSGGMTVQLLCVGALIPRKGHGMLIDALAACRDLPWRLTCIGARDRDPAAAASVRAHIAAHGLDDRIALVGEVDDMRLAAAYAAADLFVLASELEGYGMAFAEALARGLPVVGSGAGAVRDTVPPAAGLIVPVGDRAALTDALAGAIADSDLRRRLSDGAWRAGRALPDWKTAGRAFAAALDGFAAVAA